MNDDSNTGRSGETMMGFIAGIVVGAGIALLFAPAPGSDTRRRVGETASRFGNAAREKFGDARNKFNEAKNKMNDVKENVQRRAEHAGERERERSRGFGEGFQSESRTS
jgi:gas vesicle protein